MSVLASWGAIVAVAWCLWVRRIAWYCRWETAITLAAAFFGASLFLILPRPMALIDKPLTVLTGQPHLTMFIGHCLFVCGAAAVVYAMLSRFAYGDRLRARFGRWVVAPMIVGATVRLLLLTVGDVSETLDDPCNPALERIYWLTLASGVAYLLGYAFRALLILRQTEAHRPMADLYLWACASGLCKCALAIAASVAPRVGEVVDRIHIQQGLTLLFVGGFALAATYSWRLKTRPFATLKQAVSS